MIRNLVQQIILKWQSWRTYVDLSKSLA